MRRAATLALGSAAIAGAGVGGYIAADEIRRAKFTRSVTFWRESFPIYVRYRFTQWQVKDLPEEEQDARFNELHDKYAPVGLNLCLSLGGLYTKMGQVMASRADFAPPQYMKEFTRLQDDCPPRPLEEVLKVVREDYGRDPYDVFEWIDEKPLGAATIGQVHAARLRDTGQDVVIKAQYPEISLLMGNDFDTVLYFVKMAQPEFHPMMCEMRSQFMSEMNFAQEAASLQSIGEDIREHFPAVVVPRPIPGLSTQRVCVMERVYGRKLIDDVKEAYEQLAADQGLTLEEFKKKMEEMVERPDLDEFRTQVNRYNMLASIYNWTVGWVASNLKYMHAPPNHESLLKRLTQIQGHCVLKSGFFNGDLHPGNVLLLEKGEMCLIDFGSTKRISASERRALAKLVLALAEGSPEQVAEAVRATGFRTKHMDPKFLELNGRFLFDRDDDSVIGERNIQEFMEWLGQMDPTEELPDFLFLPARVCMLLRGLGTVLGAKPLSVATEWAPIAREVIQETEWVEALERMQEAHIEVSQEVKD